MVALSVEALSFEDPTHWVAIHERRTARPPSGGDALVRWILDQSFLTHTQASLVAAVQRLMLLHSPQWERWLAVSGGPHLGKTHAITSVLLRAAMGMEQPWFQTQPNGFKHVPFVYIAADATQQVPGLLARIANFCAIPTAGSGRDLHARLAAVLPQMGTRLIVIDDAQMLRRASPSASRLTDGLRTMLRLPVPIVFVGIDLEESALLWDPGRNNDTVHQLRHRHDMLEILRLQGPVGRRQSRPLLESFDKRLREIDGFSAPGLRDDPVLADLLIRCEGRPGTIIQRLQLAAIDAIYTDRIMSADLIAANLVSLAAEQDAA